MGKRPLSDQASSAALDELLDEILTDAHGDDEQLWALCQAFEDNVTLPADAFIIGEPVSVVAIDYSGSAMRGLTAKCRREDGSEHVVAAVDVAFSAGSTGARHVAAYRKWLGLEPFEAKAPAPTGRRRQHKATAEDLDLSGPIELVALSVKERAARCRLLGSERVITLRASRLWDIVPGEIVTVEPRKQWRYSGHPYLSGEITTSRLDAHALGLVPLNLEDQGMWDPKEHYWGQEDEPIEEWAKPIIARGLRPDLEMERVLPGEDPNNPDTDPIIEANERHVAGDRLGAERMLMELCQSDLRCLDAHAHLGNLAFDHRPEDAIRHYEVGLRIGELSLEDDFDGVLAWGNIDNRPFLRCMHGFGLCLWRLERFDEAERVFDRMLWLNPSDNQGVRFVNADVKAGKSWEETRNDG
ncbi:MAG: cytoplasmic protein [Acidobacteria bacterium]|nr:MAG: cytoplasmic protein [Acidobacteriota bacterium]